MECWEEQVARSKWINECVNLSSFLQLKPKTGKNGDVDVRGDVESGEIPTNDNDPQRRVIRHTMKML